MHKHAYHRYFLPILQKLYPERQNEDYIDITACLSGTEIQFIRVIQEIQKANFALVKDDSTVDLLNSDYNTIAFSAMILPLGIDYFEAFGQE
jgi:hypothetical protein